MEKRATLKQIANNVKNQSLRYYLKESLRRSSNGASTIANYNGIKTYINYIDGFVSISYHWDIIKCYNTITGKQLIYSIENERFNDLFTNATPFEVFD